MKITLFYIPSGSEAEAQSIGRRAIERQLAACANIFPIRSLYPWNGELQDDSEYVVVLKTLPAAAARLADFVGSIHSYTTPCLLRWEAEVNEAYGAWMSEQVEPSA